MSNYCLRFCDLAYEFCGGLWLSAFHGGLQPWLWGLRVLSVGWFVVEVDDERLQNVGVCLLGVDVDAVKMYELNGVEIDSWPISGIRRFWFEPLRLTIETGR